MKLEFSRKFFENTQVSNFLEIRPVGVELFHADRRREGRTEECLEGRTDEWMGGRTDTTKLTVIFRNFANAPKIFANTLKMGTDVPNTVLDATIDLYPPRLFGRQLFFLCVQKYNS